MRKDDITSNYHRGNLQSVQANPSENVKLRDRWRIMSVLKESAVWGMTCDEMEQELGMSHQSCSARFSELKRDGQIAQIGRRPTRSGRQAGVYRANEK